MSVEWKEFFPYVGSHLKHAPYPYLIDAVRDTTIEFCEKTWIWREIVDFPMVVDDRVVQVNIPPHTRLIAILSYIEDDKDKVSDDLIIREDTAILMHKAKETKTVDARVVLCPSNDATDCPEWFYKTYAEVIGYGANSRLLSLPGTPWTNFDVALLNTQMFNKVIMRTKIQMAKNFSTHSLRVRPRRFV